MRRDAAVRADLHDAVGSARGTDHCAAFVDGMTDRLFDVNMCAHFNSGDHNQRVPVVRRADNDDFGFLFCQQFAVILIELWLIAGELGDFSGGRCDLIFIHVAHRNDLRFACRYRFAQDVHSPPARADQGGAVLLRFLRADDRRSAKNGARKGYRRDSQARGRKVCRRSLQKIASVRFHSFNSRLD